MDFFAKTMHRTFHSETELRAYAAEFARALKRGDVVALSGPLGSGKTTFVRAAAAARLGGDPASSPTFTFWQRYPGNPPVDHLDFYRIDEPSAVAELGLEEAFDGDGIAFVEWWTNAPDLLPPRRYEIAFEGKGDGPRTLTIERRG